MPVCRLCCDVSIFSSPPSSFNPPPPPSIHRSWTTHFFLLQHFQDEIIWVMRESEHAWERERARPTFFVWVLGMHCARWMEWSTCVWIVKCQEWGEIPQVVELLSTKCMRKMMIMTMMINVDSVIKLLETAPATDLFNLFHFTTRHLRGQCFERNVYKLNTFFVHNSYFIQNEWVIVTFLSSFNPLSSAYITYYEAFCRSTKAVWSFSSVNNTIMMMMIMIDTPPLCL